MGKTINNPFKQHSGDHCAKHTHNKELEYKGESDRYNSIDLCRPTNRNGTQIGAEDEEMDMIESNYDRGWDMTRNI